MLFRTINQLIKPRSEPLQLLIMTIIFQYNLNLPAENKVKVPLKA